MSVAKCLIRYSPLMIRTALPMMPSTSVAVELNNACLFFLLLNTCRYAQPGAVRWRCPYYVQNLACKIDHPNDYLIGRSDRRKLPLAVLHWAMHGGACLGLGNADSQQRPPAHGPLMNNVKRPCHQRPREARRLAESAASAGSCRSMPAGGVSQVILHRCSREQMQRVLKMF